MTVVKGSTVIYSPSSVAPQGPQGFMHVEDSLLGMRATVWAVHSPRLVSLRVIDHAGAAWQVRLCPLLLHKDPDPASPVGRCFLPDEAVARGIALPPEEPEDPAAGQVVADDA